jgi:hypothetical protein
LLILEGVRSDGNVEVLRSRCTEWILEFGGLHCFNSYGDNGFILCAEIKRNEGNVRDKGSTKGSAFTRTIDNRQKQWEQPPIFCIMHAHF